MSRNAYNSTHNAQNPYKKKFVNVSVLCVASYYIRLSVVVVLFFFCLMVEVRWIVVGQQRTGTGEAHGVHIAKAGMCVWCHVEWHSKHDIWWSYGAQGSKNTNWKRVLHATFDVTAGRRCGYVNSILGEGEDIDSGHLMHNSDIYSYTYWCCIYILAGDNWIFFYCCEIDGRPHTTHTHIQRILCIRWLGSLWWVIIQFCWSAFFLVFDQQPWMEDEDMNSTDLIFHRWMLH